MKFLNLITALLLAVAVAGCGHSASDDHDHDHHHDEKLQITAYSNDFEVYAEADPLVAGQPSDILAHFTYLKNFKPLESGSVTVSLVVGGTAISQTVEKPEHPGIYHFELTPKSTGAAEMVFEITAAGVRTRIAVRGLKVYADEHEAHEAAEEAEAKSSNAVAFTKEMSWKVDFSTEEVSERPMGQVIRTMARVEPSQGDVRTVSAKSSGIVTFASGALTDGRMVSAGQALFRIDGSGMADNNLKVRFLEARSAYETSRQEYERVSELAKEKLVTEGEVLRAKNEFASAKAVYDNLREGFSSGGSVASAPISGYVTGLMVGNGQYVEAGQPLAVIAQNRDLFITAEVQPSYYPYLSSIHGANIRRPDGDTMYSLSELGGSVVSYGKSVETSSPLVPVVFRINNAPGFLPGTFVEMFITAGDGTPVRTVPKEALIEEMGNYFVYVQLTPEYFEKREVKIGRTDGRYTEILSGVNAGERVVGKGAVLVKLAHSSGTLDAHSGHVH